MIREEDSEERSLGRIRSISSSSQFSVVDGLSFRGEQGTGKRRWRARGGGEGT